MITKGQIKSINIAGNRCIVHLPLFDNAANGGKVTAEAIVNITPGIYNNLCVGDVVLVAFEENALEKPVILGKLYLGGSIEYNTRGGAGIVDALIARTSAEQPGVNTTFVYPKDMADTYTNFTSPKKIADYIKWLESLVKKLAQQLDDNFKCFKNWTQFQLEAKHVEIDDGDLDDNTTIPDSCLYQNEGGVCEVCAHNTCNRATKYPNRIRNYTTPSYSETYHTK